MALVNSQQDHIDNDTCYLCDAAVVGFAPVYCSCGDTVNCAACKDTVVMNAPVCASHGG